MGTRISALKGVGPLGPFGPLGLITPAPSFWLLCSRSGPPSGQDPTRAGVASPISGNGVSREELAIPLFGRSRKPGQCTETSNGH